MNKFLILVAFLLNSLFGYCQNISLFGDVEIDSFPNVTFYVNVFVPKEPKFNDFKLVENSKNINFNIEKITKENQNKSKTILILFEDMTHPTHYGQKKFFQELLVKSIPQFVKNGDKINVAVFDRNRDGTTPLRYLLDNYTDNKDVLLSAINNFKSINDYQSNNKSSDLYNAIYDGMVDLNKKFKPDNKLVLLLSAGFNLPSTTNNTIESIIQYSKENRIPIYSINYLIWENRTLNKLAIASNGRYFNTNTRRDNVSEATDSTISFMKKSVSMLLGFNYKISFNTQYQRDGTSHLVVLKNGNNSKEVSFTLPKCDLLCWITENKMYAGGIFTTIILIILLSIFLLFKKSRKRKLLELKKEEEHKLKLDDQEKTLLKTENKINEIERNKELEKRQRIEAEQKEMTRQLLITEIQTIRGFPVLSVTLDSQNYEYNIDEPEITVGRDASNDLYINNDNISRKHFKIYYQSRNFFIEDLKSTNGTLLNGVLISDKEQLNNNDIIQIGPIKIVFIW